MGCPMDQSYETLLGGTAVSRLLTLHAVLLHLLHLGDALPQVAHEACAVLLTRGGEHDQDLPLAPRDGRGQPDPMGVV